MKNSPRFILIGLSEVHPMSTSSGKTIIAIWHDEPTATPKVIFNLFLIANTIADACSAALPSSSVSGENQ